nr:cellulose biosynthesis cyclic di-GMP-binding regulatory protein BcsB [Octadecabacter algicola]
MLSTTGLLERGQHYVGTLKHDQSLVFEDRKAVESSGEDIAMVYRSNPNHPVILSGLPAFQSIQFNLPLDARPTSGYLQINATLQALEGVEGVLRISIDGTKRGEVLLRPGVVERSLQIPLSPTDFVRDQLVVSFSLQGEGPGSSCSRNEGLEAVVEIETTSLLALTLDRELETPRDRVHAWGNLVRVAWPDWLQQEERIRRLILASQFEMEGIQSVMVDGQSNDALTTNDMRNALPFFEAQEDDLGGADWPKELAQSGANAGIRHFYRGTTWRERYDLRDDPALRVPATLELHLALGRQIHPQGWTVTVALNNRLVYQEIVAPEDTKFEASVPLPEEMQTRENVIEISVISPHRSVGECDNGPELIAELLPTTALYHGDATYNDSIDELRATLEWLDRLNVWAFADLSASDAQVASAMLGALLPDAVAIGPNTESANIILTSTNRSIAAFPSSGPVWLVTRDPISQKLVAEVIQEGSELPRHGLGILVVPNGVNLTDVAG